MSRIRTKFAAAMALTAALSATAAKSGPFNDSAFCDDQLFDRLILWSITDTNNNASIYGPRDESHHALVDSKLKISPAARKAIIEFIKNRGLATLPKECIAVSEKRLLALPVAGEAPAHPDQSGTLFPAAPPRHSAPG